MSIKLKKLISLLSVFCLLASSLVLYSGAAEVSENTSEGTNYPFIFVHGMFGWGSDSVKNAEKPYWGFSEENNVMTYLTEKGYKVYNPSVGCISSAWDRCCELYAQLTGTVVDYGEVHSKNAGHSRYGRDYTGKAIMGEPWDMETPINLVGHSFGGATIRLFASLIAYGCEEEIEGTSGEISPLFNGGHEELIYSVTTIAAPHNGSVVANYANSCPLLPFYIAILFNKDSVADEPGCDINADQWGIKDTVNIFGCLKFALSGDNVAYDLTIKGSRELNKKIKTVKTAYYFSYYSSITEDNGLGYYKIKDTDNVSDFMKTSSGLISNTVNVFVDGEFLDKSWTENDGIVPTKSAMYPLGADYTYYTDNSHVQPGIWNVMPKLNGVGHVDFCSAQSNAFGSEDAFFDFYESLVRRVCAL